MQTIAVLLTVHNRKVQTMQCLANVYQQSLPKDCCIDVWLTNDGCTDGTAEAVAATYPDVHILQGDGNLYWNRGMYKAWQEAARHKAYDYYLWLNDDTFIYNDCIAELLKTANDYVGKAIVVGACCDNLPQKALTYGGRRNDGALVEPNGTAAKVDYFNGNIVLVPDYVYSKIGCLDNYFMHSKGDFDYGLRARKARITIVQAGKILGQCDKHNALDDWCNPTVPLKKRLKKLHQPNGMPPKETFYFEKKHYNIGVAAFHFCTIYIRCFMPNLWKMKK